MCLYPRILRNRKYTPNKKNGQTFLPVPDDRVKYIAAGCGDCMECVKQKARNWQQRLKIEVKHNTNGKFICFTFSNEEYKRLVLEAPQEIRGYNLDNYIATLAIRRFLERWRKEYKKSVRHWLITELGHNGTENIHIHGIIWTDEELNKVERIWKYGHMWKGKKVRGKIINYVNERTINYMIKYVTKKDLIHKTYRPIILTSAGMGKQYVESYDATTNRFNGKNTIEYLKNEKGYKIAINKYWRNKIYTDEEREQLWIQKLDEGKRYVNGEMVMEENKEEYYKLLEYHRIKNKQLGYGDGVKDWNREQYENERRKIKQNERIIKTRKIIEEGKEHKTMGNEREGEAKLYIK